MENRSHREPIAEFVTNAAKADLPREVLSYADGLVLQAKKILDRHGITMEDLKRQEVREKIPPEDRNRLRELAARNAAARRGEIDTAARREIETMEVAREKNIRKEFFDKLDVVVAEHCIGQRGGHVVPLDKPHCWTKETQAAIERLPLIPADILLKSGGLMEEMIEQLQASLFGRKMDAGAIATMAMNRLIAGIPEALRSDVYQSIDGGGMRGIGYGWHAGSLKVYGTAGEGLGERMSGGLIQANQTGAYAGLMMRGGTLQIVSPDCRPSFVGEQMEGGTIFIVRAGFGLGKQMKGGDIDAQYGSEAIGDEMSGGKIFVRECDQGDLGTKMTGGSIETDSARLVGLSMRGGRITLTGDCLDAGKGMSGGSISVRNVGSGGCPMSGGQLEIRGNAEVVGNRMTGGEVVISGDAKHVSRPKHGGTIRFVGPGSLRKNVGMLFT